MTECDTSWIVALEAVDEEGNATFTTPGWQRASPREADEEQSGPGRPVMACTTPRAVPPGETVRYRIPLCPNARRLPPGHPVTGSGSGSPSAVPTRPAASPTRSTWSTSPSAGCP
ncbi:CocE/NonD family hydrolase C-terminal non-catalytic domain-containing protein [Streptomyces sp. NPDC058622]|uniref:CocE/NonD family hydrolase C-terminal non-catalytic domain-containing protein n=1 Tax=Streptomyces sp. NPDC058622 TaxID=3346562 RepID=UPI00365B514E